MNEVRNPENRLVYCVDENAKAVERLEKGWITRIEFKSDGTLEITHRKKSVA
ncbi:hypothetical protein KCG48_12975 [Proteiniclasticum sp. BAD-10]|uniref:Uncharacterized protein n=1 Tax=Proteiniclasticum sediminis TaxID=2804028 RepID=A0A941HR59_9CLOT|nr:hypothetical protein [Proteiniclasticum sediminis]MBR0577229.1 hypothetical protein [Proteiniclasticum sediminis]